MSRKQSNALRRYVRTLKGLGIPFELAAIMVADRMREDGIPITEQNLDKAFSL